MPLKKGHRWYLNPAELASSMSPNKECASVKGADEGSKAALPVAVGHSCQDSIIHQSIFRMLLLPWKCSPWQGDEGDTWVREVDHGQHFVLSVCVDET